MSGYCSTVLLVSFKVHKELSFMSRNQFSITKQIIEANLKKSHG
ncbi:helix-turn-helix domain-containing protein, partial [Vibrio parahaemolyticus]|nr:helix-turn-helix domain-containing protein [Vibrio parahaemolyticus]